MDVSTWPDWISAVWGVLAGLGGLFAWWQATGSRRARRGAQQADERAQAAAVDSRRQVEIIEHIAGTLAGPPLVAEPWANGRHVLRNRRGDDAVVVEVVNGGNWLHFVTPGTLQPLTVPFTIPPYGSVVFGVLETQFEPAPPELVLRLHGGGVLHVALPAPRTR